MRLFKKIFASVFLFTLVFSAYSATFNDNLSESERETIEKGEILIKKINYSKYICLENGTCEFGDRLIKLYKKLSPKYLAEVIQIKPYEGNEDLPERMQELLANISDYAGIPYWSERHERFWDLYSSAELVSEEDTENGKEIQARIDMEPFGVFNQKITIEKEDEVLLYDSENLNKLNYEGIDVVFKGKMKMSILLFRDGDNWVLYGIGGVNAPRIPFLTQRIDTSFINRIKTFCNYIFEKL
ncbi:MAG: hypothetical protein MJ181_07730 [Treponema sp.]|nr:hypothetical protein [Treponema sp.]